MTTDLLYRIKPLDHLKEIAGTFVSCEWCDEWNTLVYDINSNRYRIIQGTSRKDTINQVIDTFLDFHPYSSASVKTVAALIDKALPESIV